MAISFVIVSAMAYPRFQQIVDLLERPLGDQKLYYLTPAGGFSFMIKVCMYVGLIGILPVIIYHLYKFMAPVMQKNRARSILGYTVASSFLAIVGIVFAYVVSLPAALKFLTGFSVGKIDAMLTIDAYMSFVTAYLLAGAILFQLPLIMLIVNSVTPLRPKALMSYQRHIIVGSFVAAAILSPTPDVVNQTLLAAPMVVMYQAGIGIIWCKNRIKARQQAAREYEAYYEAHTQGQQLPQYVDDGYGTGNYYSTPEEQSGYAATAASPAAASPITASAASTGAWGRAMSDVLPARSVRQFAVAEVPVQVAAAAPVPSAPPAAVRSTSQRRYVDGIVAPRRTAQRRFAVQPRPHSLAAVSPARESLSPPRFHTHQQAPQVLQTYSASTATMDGFLVSSPA